MKEAIQATNFANVPNSTIPFPSKFASTKVPDISSSIPTANSNSHHHHQAMHYQQNASQGSGKAVSDANFMALQLNSVSCMLPMAQDSSKIYTRLSTNKYCQSVPPYYPKNGFPEIFSLETFHKFPLELLFILFYRADATLGQKLAAKTLKNQSWRFHVDYKMWFQRHREPRMMTDEHESGSYIFFDFEKWLQRTKENFTFEYKYLEDKDL
ncbi:MAG: trophectodermal cell differentiation [Marteilia pararefringens]